MTLVSQLLEAHNGYPQNLVLLYFKEPSFEESSSVETSYGVSGDKRANLSANSNGAYNKPRPVHYQLTSDAIQYKLIGELLEIKLNELLLGRHRSAGGRSKGSTDERIRSTKLRPLAVLNWHTTFHYGFTKNPFRQLIRRHLFHQRSAAIVNHQCPSSLPVLAPNRPITRTESGFHSTLVSNRSLHIDREAIYIVVGHYYEHLGLMLALNELNLLGGNRAADSDRSRQSNAPPANQLSVVVGVDFEEYDERDDSVRFLRGLLMDENNDDNGNREHNLQSSSPMATSSFTGADQMDSIAQMYRHYLGVVPAKPKRATEFLDEMRQTLYNQTYAASSSLPSSSPLASGGKRLGDESIDSSNSKLATERFQTIVVANQTTLDVLQQTTQLLQFMRLPVEAFYLYDSILLLGAYTNDCIRTERLSLEQCSDGRRVQQWFKNREYVSLVSPSSISFDSYAQTEGSYTLITRRTPTMNINQPDASDVSNEEEFGLAPIGQFVRVNGTDPIAHKVELFVNYDTIDPVWLPLWCIVRESNNSICTDLKFQSKQEDKENAAFPIVSVVCFALTLVSSFLLTAYCYIKRSVELRLGSVDRANVGWFDEQDVKNFLKIVHSHLLTPDTLREDMILVEDDRESSGEDESRILLELHCHMFPFPSCRFVHWLTALHQLKEMMFQFIPDGNEEEDEREKVAPTWPIRIKRKSSSVYKANNFGGFFRQKHGGTASLRLLLNKYKSINECFCCLSDLNNKCVVRLYGATLLFNDFGKTVRLVVEQPNRGNLRDALNHLKEVLLEDENGEEEDKIKLETKEFMPLLIFSLVNDLLEGLDYLHKSRVEYHGELRATTCFLATNWRLKLSGFHTAQMRRSLGDYKQKNVCTNGELHPDYLNDLVYSAPEILINLNKRNSIISETMRLADIYSFAFVFYELLVGQEPWSCLTQVTSSKLLIDRVKVESSFRPPLSRLDNSQELEQVAAADLSSSTSSPSHSHSHSHLHSQSHLHLQPQSHSPSVASSNAGADSRCSPKRIRKRLDLDGVQRIIRSCWSQSTSRRPQSAATLRDRLLDCCLPNKTSFNTENIHGQVVICYANLLELAAVYRKKNLALECKRSKELELKLLPENVIARLRNARDQKRPAKDLFACRRFECVSFCSFRIIMLPVNSDGGQEKVSNILEQLNEILDQLDELVHSYQKHIHLLDSQVDSSMRFMVYAGEPLLAGEPTNSNRDTIYNHSQLIASFALQLIDLSNRWQSKFSITANMRVRCGLHCGPVLGGLLSGQSTDGTGGTNGSKLARYVLFGTPIQQVDALESNSLPQRIHISSEFRLLLIQSFASCREPNDKGSRQSYVMIKREGKIYAKNLGEFESYWLLNGPRLTASDRLMLSSTSDNQS